MKSMGPIGCDLSELRLEKQFDSLHVFEHTRNRSDQGSSLTVVARRQFASRIIRKQFKDGCLSIAYIMVRDQSSAEAAVWPAVRSSGPEKRPDHALAALVLIDRRKSCS
ncbi:hypothetical protein Q3C01_26025 [Bradyrhizobium sp. UFLA05-109]